MDSVGCEEGEAPRDKARGAVQVRRTAWAIQHFLPACSQYKHNLPGSFCSVLPIVIRVTVVLDGENMLIWEMGKGCKGRVLTLEEEKQLIRCFTGQALP